MVATALVTGAGQGIGRAIAIKLAKDGFSIVATGRNEANVRETAAMVDGRHFSLDVRSRASIRTVADQLEEVKVLVNCAGVFPTGPVMGVTPETYREVMDVNVGGVLFTTQVFQGHLARSQGVVVSITSIAATMASPGLGVYSASKAAVKMLTELMAVELGPLGIRVNAVAPGNTHTESNGIALQPGEEPQVANLIPLRRIAVPEDMANAVAFLASEAANYITGHTITVDGGFSLGTSGYYRAANRVEP